MAMRRRHRLCFVLPTPIRSLLLSCFLMLSLALAVFCFFSFFPWLQKKARPLPKPQPATLAATPNTHGLTGIRFVQSRGDQKVSLAADWLQVRNKKMGYLRIGIMKEALLQGVVFSYHGALPFSQAVPPPSSPAAAPVAASAPSSPASTMENTWDEIARYLPAKRLASILCRPISIELSDLTGQRCTLQAANAILDLRGKTFTLDGDVTVRSGPRTLTAARLQVKPQAGKLVCQQQCRLQDETGSIDQDSGATFPLFLATKNN